MRPVFRSISVLLVLLLVFSVVSAQPADVRIGALIKNVDNPFFTRMEAGYAFAAERYGIDIVVGSVPTEADLEDQRGILTDWLANEDLDALIVTPFRAESLLDELAAATAEGLPIINTDEIIPVEAAEAAGVEITTRIASNNVRAGTLAAQYLLDTLEPGSSVAVIEGAVGTKSSQDRVIGFIETAELNGLRVVSSRPADWDTDLAYQTTLAYLDEYPNLRGIFTANDGMALGAMRALDEQGRADEIIVTSVDAIPSALEAVEAGALGGTVAQYPEEMAVLAVEAALKVIQGRPVPPEIESPVVLIQAENIALASSQLGDPALDGVTVHAVTKNLDNPFFLDMVEGYDDAAAALGVEVVVGSVATAADTAEQEAIVQGWLDDGVGVMVATPLDGEILLDEMLAASEQGISLLNVDELIPPDVAEEMGIDITARIASNNVRAGSIAADFAVNALEAGASVAVIEGVGNTQSSLDRVQGFIATAEGGGLRVVASRPANWNTEEAYALTQEYLATYDDLQAIFAANDGMAFGVMQALEEAGMLDDVIVLSVDAVPEARQAVIDGRLSGTVAQFPYEMAFLAVENAIKALEGRPISPTIESPVVLLTQDVLADE